MIKIRLSSFAVLAIALSTSALVSQGSAQAAELGTDDEVPFVQRDLVVAPMTLAPELDARLIRVPGGSMLYSQSAGARFGVVEDLEVRATPLSFYAGDASGYGAFLLDATYRFLRTDVAEIGVTGGLYIASGDVGGIGLQAGLPVRLHLGGVFRLDTGLYFAGEFAEGAMRNASFRLARIDMAPAFIPDPMLPVEATLQINDMFFAGLDTGIGFAYSQDFGQTTFIPLGARLGVTIAAEERPFLDITTGFRFPMLITPGSRGDAVQSGLWEIDIAKVTAYIDLNK